MRKKIDKYIAFYNQKRPHTTLNLQTPEQYEGAFLENNRNSASGKRSSDFRFSAASAVIFNSLDFNVQILTDSLSRQKPYSSKALRAK